MRSEPMTEKRKITLRNIANYPWIGSAGNHLREDLLEALDEIDRQEARIAEQSQIIQRLRRRLEPVMGGWSDHCTCRDGYCLGLCPYSMSEGVASEQPVS